MSKIYYLFLFCQNFCPKKRKEIQKTFWPVVRICSRDRDRNFRNEFSWRVRRRRQEQNPRGHHWTNTKIEDVIQEQTFHPDLHHSRKAENIADNKGKVLIKFMKKAKKITKFYFFSQMTTKTTWKTNSENSPLCHSSRSIWRAKLKLVAVKSTTISKIFPKLNKNSANWLPHIRVSRQNMSRGWLLICR